MRLDFRSGAAVALGYGAAMAIWMAASRIFPSLWPESPWIRFARPKLELLLALVAAAVVFGFNILYHRGLRLPRSRREGLRPAVFIANVMIIWSPVALVLLARRQGPATCLFASAGLPYKLAWGLLAAIAATTLYSLVRHGRIEPGIFAWTFLRRRVWDLFQGAIQYFGFGFFVVRLDQVFGTLPTAVLCGALYGAVKYPMLLRHYKLKTPQATGLVVFSAALAAAGFLSVLFQRDLIVPSLVHSFMDRAQGFRLREEEPVARQQPLLRSSP